MVLCGSFEDEAEALMAQSVCLEVCCFLISYFGTLLNHPILGPPKSVVKTYARCQKIAFSVPSVEFEQSMN